MVGLSKKEMKDRKQVEVQNWVQETAVRGVSHAVPAHGLLTYKAENGQAKAQDHYPGI